MIAYHLVSPVCMPFRPEVHHGERAASNCGPLEGSRGCQGPLPVGTIPHGSCMLHSPVCHWIAPQISHSMTVPVMPGGSTLRAWVLGHVWGTRNHNHDAALLCRGALTDTMLIHLLGFAGLHISLLFPLSQDVQRPHQHMWTVHHDNLVS